MLLWKEDLLKPKSCSAENKDSGCRYQEKKLVGQLERVNRQMLAWKRECEEGCKVMKSLEGFPVMLMSAKASWKNIWKKNRRGRTEDTAGALFSDLSFSEIADRLDESYVIYSMLDENGRFLVKLFCIDTSSAIQECLDMETVRSFFRQPFFRLRIIKVFWSVKDDYYRLCQDSVLPEQRRVLIGRDVSSRYKRRGPKEYEKIAVYIRRQFPDVREIIWSFFLLTG